MSVDFFMPPGSVTGLGSLSDAINDIAVMGFSRALVVTDKLIDELVKNGIRYTVF